MSCHNAGLYSLTQSLTHHCFTFCLANIAFLSFPFPSVCSLCAVVQGMDETTLNGAQSIYKTEFGIEDSKLIIGIVNGAPYLCCAVLSCWLTGPLNYYLGRRGTIIFCCAVSAVACFSQAWATNWYQLMAIRFCLGLGIGPKSATTPMYAAECAPPKLRGAFVMQWQVWTAFGIM